MDDEPRIAPRIPLRAPGNPATLEPAAPAPMQRSDDVANVGRGPMWRNAPAGAANATLVPIGVMALLEQLTWVHELGLTKDCQGCDNDGEPGYCQGPAPSWEQQDLRESEDDEPPIACHCGHRIVAVLGIGECGCSGPGAWHCDGEDSQHWAKGEDPEAECGHCGSEGRQLE